MFVTLMFFLFRNEPHYFDSELASFILYDVSASSLLGRESMLTSVPIEMTNERQVIMQVTFRTRASDALLMVIEHKLKYEFIQLDVSAKYFIYLTKKPPRNKPQMKIATVNI